MGRRTTSAFMAGTMAAGALGFAALAPSAQAAVSAPIDCPTALPTAQAVDGLTGTGFTVTNGTKPTPFTVTVIGKLTDAIGPGIDMIVVEAHSTVIDKAGIWAGISGSPVYTSDGKLLGSMSYGFSGSGTIGGLTPGADILKVSDAATKTAASVAATSALQKKLVASGEVSKAAAAGSNFTPLAPSMSISGPGPKNTKLLKKLSKKLGTPIRVNGDTATGALEPASTISAGSNFATALSYGFITFGGLGTTTTVCNGKAVAFGHPFLHTSKPQASAHNASAVYIQDDPVFGSFKQGNFGGVVGTLDKDSLTGIRAQLGKAPGTYSITSSLSVDGAAPVTRTTTGVDQTTHAFDVYTYAGLIADAHLESAITDATDSEWGGSADLTFTVKGTRAGGAPFTVSLRDHYSSMDWLSAYAGPALENLVDSLLSNKYEKVTISSIDVTGSLSDEYKQWSVDSVKVWKGGAWSSSKNVSVSAGKTVKFRAALSPYQSDKVTYWEFALKAPKGSSGSFGTASILTADNYPYPSPKGTKAQKFDTLLKQLSQPYNDSLIGLLDVEGFTPVANGKRATAPIESYEKDYNITVK
ncbi:hypothetical protein ACIB24_03215 [Spongisporangium articulatum]|uniref:Peptidase S55 domain-containing protein n=1 Tax=Spongisporangium articulatum TaxID=3362603 RepID=A0ABW8AI82_9ACTN